MRVADHLHIGDAAAERPPYRTEEAEEGDSAVPVFPPGEQNRGKRAQHAGDHRSVLVAVVAANAPAY